VTSGLAKEQSHLDALASIDYQHRSGNGS
jgi:hypothetical protein